MTNGNTDISTKGKMGAQLMVKQVAKGPFCLQLVGKGRAET